MNGSQLAVVVSVAVFLRQPAVISFLLLAHAVPRVLQPGAQGVTLLHALSQRVLLA